jgi:hypothetical protein
MDVGVAHVCSVTEHMTLERARIDVPVPKKRAAAGSGYQVRPPCARSPCPTRVTSLTWASLFLSVAGCSPAGVDCGRCVVCAAFRGFLQGAIDRFFEAVYQVRRTCMQ